MLTRLIRLVLDWSHIYWSEVLCLIIAGVSGGGSLLLIKSDSCWLCKTFGPWSVEVCIGGGGGGGGSISNDNIPDVITQ